MVEEELALQELLRASTSPETPHRFDHYLYFPSRRDGEAIAEHLRGLGFTVESRLGADDVNWLVLATHHLVPERQVVEAARTSLEELARQHGGEYDGWEASPSTSHSGT
ncbi:ribonuclease E inhibitor RraB [Pyxidicoccus sp. 3LG]